MLVLFHCFPTCINNYFIEQDVFNFIELHQRDLTELEIIAETLDQVRFA